MEKNPITMFGEQRPDSISDLSNLLHRFLRPFGLTPFCLVTFPASKLRPMYTIALIIYLIVQLIVCLSIIRQHLYVSGSDVSRFLSFAMNVFMFALETFTAISALATKIIYRRRLDRNLTDLLRTEIRLSQLIGAAEATAITARRTFDNTNRPCRATTVLVYYYISMAITWLAGLLFDMYLLRRFLQRRILIAFMILKYAPYVIVASDIVYLLVIVSVIRRYFRQTTRVLDRHRIRKRYAAEDELSRKFGLLKTRETLEIHVLLRKMCASYNEAFGPSIVGFVAHCFASLVTIIYYQILFLVTAIDHDIDAYILIVHFAFWCVLYLTLLYIMLNVFSSTSTEGNDIVRSVHRLLLDVHYEPLRTTLENCSWHLYHDKIEFTGCGLFKLDFTLLRTIVSGTIAYLIFLVEVNLLRYKDALP